MPESLNPAFVQISYSSPRSIHTMRIPTRQYDDPDGGFPDGSFQRWSDDTFIDADTMINDLVSLMADVMPTTHSFINYIIYKVPGAGIAPQPVHSNTLNVAGTVLVPGWWEAVQMTFNFRDTDFEAMKLVLLDADSSNLFGKLVDVSSVAALDAIADEVSDITNAWSSRNNFRPATILSVTRTLNEALRKAYGHTG